MTSMPGRDRPSLRERLHPGTQFQPRRADFAFLVDAAACVFHAIGDRFVVNIQADVVHSLLRSLHGSF